MQKEVIIDIQSITKKYKHDNVILENVSAKIFKGDRIGIIGPNGSGKSTISEMITQIKLPTSGKIIYKDESMKLGIQFQESNYPQTVRVWDMINYYLQTYKINASDQAIDELINYFDLKQHYKKIINSLSGGQKQRLNILLSIIHNPDLILLDELTTGLDIETKDRMRTIIEEKIISHKDKTLLLVSHSMSEAQSICNRIWVIMNKKIAYDLSVKEIIKKYENLDNFIRKVMEENRKEKKNKGEKNESAI